jgi:3'-phosphoadenosine 5'-phosphosulfate (PAPS) 3'-phosphatase
MSKVFGIGLSKTGTTSLARALELLGYRTKDYLGISRYDPNDLTCLDLETIDQNDAFTDTPIPSFYKALDQRFPNSKFILTVRDIENWSKSCKKQFTKALAEKESADSNRLIADLYGCALFEKQKFESGYKRYVNDAIEHFEGRENDLLVIDICGGEGWERLCAFLGKPVPDIPFPKANVSAVQWINIEDVIKIATDAGEEVRKMYTRKLTRESLSNSESVRESVLSNLLHRARLGYQSLSRILKKNSKEKELEKSYQASKKVIYRSLSRLQPALPILSRDKSSTPYKVRKCWSHLWLVDPLNGFDSEANNIERLAISIALIEDGQPILGVVYAPASDTLYYAKGGMGSYKKIGPDDALSLRSIPNRKEHRYRTKAEGGNSMSNGNVAHRNPETDDRDHENCQCIRCMCKLAEGTEEQVCLSKSFFEWEIAAVNAVIKFDGKDIYDFESGRAMRYNQRNLSKRRLVIK